VRHPPKLGRREHCVLWGARRGRAQGGARCRRQARRDGERRVTDQQRGRGRKHWRERPARENVAGPRRTGGPWTPPTGRHRGCSSRQSAMASRQSAMVRMRLEDCRTMEERSPRGVGGAERMARKIARVLGHTALRSERQPTGMPYRCSRPGCGDIGRVLADTEVSADVLVLT